ncbi:MAG: S-adenosyl-l-methionine hydroxide adenosyltransferase family protein [Proteobacteria bacterium]|nr:S-adenosyl-l-methionine hydroxide adenosyltransferase family protein [Pseudomonadota bacterium]
MQTLASRGLHRLAFAALALALGLAFTAPAPAAPARARPLIVFMTDFGTLDDAVAICKGVMKTIAPGAEILDITHEVTPFSIAEGARLLGRTSQYYPAGTVFVTVVDPGVGTSRKSIVVHTGRDQYFVLPDNGLITQVARRDGIREVREIENPGWLLAGSASSTFHGRDIYSPVGAHLARGDDPRAVGPVIADVVRLAIPEAGADAAGIHGQVVALDGPFGNLVTNVDRDLFLGLGYRVGDAVRVSIGGTEQVLPYAATFGGVDVGKPLLFIDSRGLVSLAINQGNFAQQYGVVPPVSLAIARPVPR